MKQYLLIAFLACIVAVSGCTDNGGPEDATPDSSQPDDTVPTQNNESDSTHTVTFTGNGFQPADLTVDQGDTVVWESNADTSMWVASDRHPSHTNYAGSSLNQHCQNGDQTEAAFDQCSTGDRFTFTFEKNGEWSYHNHQPFIQGGTITVE